MKPLNSAENLLNILFVWVDTRRTELGLTEISRATGINKSTVYKILLSLRERRLVELNIKTKKYSLGPRVLELSTFFTRSLNIKDAAHPFLQELAGESGKTVTFALRKEAHLVFIDRVDGSESVRFYCDIGKVIPYNSGAAAKAVFAYLPPEQREKISGEPEKKFTDSTKSWNQMAKEAELIRERGYSISDEEVDRGVIAVGAPVFDGAGNVLAGLALAGLKCTINGRELEKMAFLSVECARSISMKMGAPFGDSLYAEWERAAFGGPIVQKRSD
ncbi:MAG: IclR family transcriptional regulator [Aminivibrio sp.]